MAFEVRHPEIEAVLKDIGHLITEALEGKGYGFSLMIFSFGEKGNMFYCSNAERHSICDAMREFIARNEPN